MPTYVRECFLPFSPAQVWAYHAHLDALTRLTPPGAPARLIQGHTALEAGALDWLEAGYGPLTIPWRARIAEVRPGEGFTDVQERGPFAKWSHKHHFLPAPGGCRLVDEIEYALPIGALGEAVAGRMVAGIIDSGFAWRHRRTLLDLSLMYAGSAPAGRRIGITGASGTVGRALAAALRLRGDVPIALVRHAPAAGQVRWDPTGQRTDVEALAGLDAVVHLAGEPVFGRWTAEKRAKIQSSRVLGTAALAKALASAPRRPAALVSASAVGFYGDRREPVDESSPRGRGFLADVAEGWERAADPARDAGIRVAHPRIGLVLSNDDGVLANMAIPARLGVLGPIAGGRQGFPWITLDDLVRALLFLLDNNLSGPFNAVAPAQDDQASFVRALSRVFRQPATLPVPGFAVRFALGDAGDEMLVQGAPVRPQRLREAGFRWDFADAEDACRFALGRA
jgi:uncharacterized protein (TIGR01777 family)